MKRFDPRKEPVKLSGKTVVAKNKDGFSNIDTALNKLSRKLKNDKMFDRLKELRFHTKLSEKTKKKRFKGLMRERSRLRDLVKDGVASPNRPTNNWGKKTKRRFKYLDNEPV